MRALVSGTRRYARAATAALALATAYACGGASSPSGVRPNIISILPTSGSTFGGELVTLSGTNFAPGMTVTFGGTAAAAVVVNGSTSATVTTPARAAGTVDVVATVGTQRDTLTAAYRFTAPVTTDNAPPQIDSITVRGSRPNMPASYGNVNESLRVTAAITDPETPLSSLVFEWKTSAGTIVGTTTEATLQTPPAASNLEVELTVTENYRAPDANGLPVSKQHVVRRSALVTVRNEVGEVSDMAEDFLERFSQSSYSPTDVMHNFIDGCGAGNRGRQDELEQVTNNRRNYLMLPGWSVGTPNTQVLFGGVSPFRARRADAWSSLQVRWRYQCRRTNAEAGADIGCAKVGDTGETFGTDWVTAKFDAATRRWWLCDSDFEGQSTLNGVRMIHLLR